MRSLVANDDYELRAPADFAKRWGRSGAALNGLAAACIFIFQGAVLWPQTLALMLGTICGGFLGSHIARMLPKRVISVLVVVAGVALTIMFARRYWF